MPRLIKSITAALVIKKGGKKVARFFEKKTTLRLTVNNALVKLYLVREDLVLQTLVTIAVCMVFEASPHQGFRNKG